MTENLHRAIGIMSGTSLDGIDAALIETDGESHIRLIASSYMEYPAEVRARVAAIATGDVPLNEVMRVDKLLSNLYVQAVQRMERQNVDLSTVDVIGCHGQTIRHLPDEGLTWQLGDPNFLAEHTGRPVVMDFRRRDMAAGGQGAPLVPLFHKALMGAERWPCAVVNIGGVANVTVMDAHGNVSASDCGPGVGLLNSWVQEHTGFPYDKDGDLAAKGTMRDDVLAHALNTIPFWKRPLPRSADRYEFASVMEKLKGVSVQDGAATLVGLTALGIARTLNELNAQGPVFAVGGGSQNPAIMEALRALKVDARLGAEAGLRTQTMEAECFAWLAVRRLKGLPFSTPATTGSRQMTVGGLLTY